MFERLLKLRYIAVVVVALSIMHSIMFLFIGARMAVKTYWNVLRDVPAGEQTHPAMELLHSLDMFLVSLVVMILALGIAKLFLLPHTTTADRNIPLPSWLQIETFSDLKVLLWETILSALLIIAMSTLASGVFKTLEWTALVIPSAILLLAMSLYFVRKH
jgi:uncharacterized membrane protein YqhA